jgi:hypothetical protein
VPVKRFIRIALPAFLSAFCVSCTESGFDCRFLDEGYKRFDRSLTSLAEYPLENVPDEVVGSIQRCWAERPYESPQHSILLSGARVASPSRYYLIFEPWGITDMYLVFSVERGNSVVDAYTYSTFAGGDPIARQPR